MAEYKSFKTDKQKIGKLWETADSSEALLKEKENQIKKLYREKGVFKTAFELYDSGWIVATPIDLTARTTIKGTPLPSLLEEDITINGIKFPEDLLPFIALQVEFRSAPDINIVPVAVYENHGNPVNYVEVFGDSDLIYRGIPRGLNFPFSNNDLEAEMFQESHTKKRWNVNINYMDAGFEWKFQPLSSTSSIVRLTARYNVEINCGDHEDSDTIDVYTDNDFASARPTDKILDMDADGFTVIGRLTEERWIDTTEVENSTGFFGQTAISLGHNPTSINYVTGAGSYTFSAPNTILLDTPLMGGEAIEVSYQWCEQNLTVTDETEITLEWSELTSFTVRQPASLFKKIGSTFVLQSSGDLTLDTSTVDSIVSNGNSFVGYWLFYDEGTVWKFGIGDTGDVDVLNDDLQNVPDTSIGHGVGETLPYSTITLKQNVDVDLFSKSTAVKIADDIHSLSHNRLNTFIWKRQGALVDGIGTYSIKPQIRALIMERATELANTTTVNIFDDAYTVSGTTYAKTQENHQDPDVKFYKTPESDMEYRVRLVYKSPFVYFKHIQDHEI